MPWALVPVTSQPQLMFSVRLYMCKDRTVLANSEQILKKIKEYTVYYQNQSFSTSRFETQHSWLLFGSQIFKLYAQTEVRADWKWPLASSKPFKTGWNTGLVITFIVTESLQPGITLFRLPGNLKNIVLSTSGLFCGQLSSLTTWILVTGGNNIKK